MVSNAAVGRTEFLLMASSLIFHCSSDMPSISALWEGFEWTRVRGQHTRFCHVSSLPYRQQTPWLLLLWFLLLTFFHVRFPFRLFEQLLHKLSILGATPATHECFSSCWCFGRARVCHPMLCVVSIATGVRELHREHRFRRHPRDVQGARACTPPSTSGCASGV